MIFRTSCFCNLHSIVRSPDDAINCLLTKWVENVIFMTNLLSGFSRDVWWLYIIHFITTETSHWDPGTTNHASKFYPLQDVDLMHSPICIYLHWKKRSFGGDFIDNTILFVCCMFYVASWTCNILSMEPKDVQRSKRWKRLWRAVLMTNKRVPVLTWHH